MCMMPRVQLMYDQVDHLTIAMCMQANKPAIIEGKEGRYPPISAEKFVQERLRAIYLKPEA